MTKAGVMNKIHKHARKNFPRRHVVVLGLNHLWMADLMDLQQYSHFNSGYKYVLIVINAFSKFIWAEPLKTKNAKDVSRACKKSAS